MNERELFEAALDKSPAERAQLLDKACADDVDLQKRVESLLAKHDEENSFLEKPAIFQSATKAFQPLTETLGSQIGPYKLL